MSLSNVVLSLERADAYLRVRLDSKDWFALDVPERRTLVNSAQDMIAAQFRARRDLDMNDQRTREAFQYAEECACYEQAFWTARLELDDALAAGALGITRAKVGAVDASFAPSNPSLIAPVALALLARFVERVDPGLGEFSSSPLAI